MKNENWYEGEYYEDIEKSAPFQEEFKGNKTHRRKIAVKFFRKYGVKKILDVGCCLGFDAVYFMHEGFKVYACDVSQKAIEYAKEKNPGPVYFLCDLEKEKPQGKFDGIYSFEVIEHIVDYDVFLTNLYKSLKKGGILALSTPNVLAPRNRISLLLGKDWWFRTKYHLHFFSPSSLKETLERNGFEVLKIGGSGRISFLGPNFSGSLVAVAKKEG